MARESRRKNTHRARAPRVATPAPPPDAEPQGSGAGPLPSVQSQDTADYPVVEQFSIPTDLVQHILLGPANDRRVLQDSPILGDVWLAYAANPAGIQDLLITPVRNATAAAVAAEISSLLPKFPRSGKRAEQGARVAYLQGLIAARLYFNEVLNILVPMTRWWHQGNILDKLKVYDPQVLENRLRRLLAPERFKQLQFPASTSTVRFDPECENFSALDRYVTLAGFILWVGEQLPPSSPDDLKVLKIEEVIERYKPHTDKIVTRMLDAYHQIRAAQPAARLDDPDESGEGGANIFQVSLNRPASTALNKSVPAVKADAAHRLFNVACDKIVWAVLDAGIDGNHPAFYTPEGRPRIRRTFDFTNIREILSSDNADITDDRLEELLAGVELGPTRELRLAEAKRRLGLIAEDALKKRPINWDIVEELITLATPPPPPSAHGTHVAGIIGANPKGVKAREDQKRVNAQEETSASAYGRGMCPDIRLYDFRVLAKTVADTEFAVIAALQYIRNKNERHSYTTIHGVNLSLSIPHSVRNFACGRTPVCNECERLVESGVVVVAAAGNRGYQDFQTNDGTYEGYAAFSITDPGNGEGVITVGATHGNWPHTYGVSFFSSRGPTGDGRLKPDLVAPGERILAPVLDGGWGAESGTSMAAPHVSGAAAMLLARYPEMVGQPRRVKRILCESATDLGRDRTFQGHGMLDVLRALQSV
jgi:serine protease AprX